MRADVGLADQPGAEDLHRQDTDGTSGLRGRRVLSWRQWGKFGTGVYDRGEGEGTWRSGQHRLVFSLTPTPPLSLQIDGGPPQRIAPGVELISLYPAGPSIRTTGTNSRYGHVCWDVDLYDTIAPDLPRPPPLDPALTFRDPLLGQLLRALVEEIGGNGVDRLLADSLMAALAMRVAQRFGSEQPQRQPDLPPVRIRRVLDYIDAHLGQDLTLAELAGVACLSPCHFSRSFKEAVGVGPQRCVVQRRVERAKALLCHRGDSLAGIAAAVGFADQSHFTAAFRRETGMTPGRFRAATA